MYAIDIWQNAKNSKIKNEIIRELIRCFGSMISTQPKEYSIPDNKGKFKSEDMTCCKLLDASRYVVRAKNAILKNENFDTREFTLYIASKKWVHNILQPLLSLCSDRNDITGDDIGLAMRCCGLAIVLLKRLSDNTVKILNTACGLEKARKRSKNDLMQKSLLVTQKSKKNEDDSDKDDEKEDEAIVALDRADKAALLNNAKMQGIILFCVFCIWSLNALYMYSVSIAVVQRCTQSR